jgi:hypothetical protein
MPNDPISGVAVTAASRRRSSSSSAKPSRSSTTASPSIVKLLALIRRDRRQFRRPVMGIAAVEPHSGTVPANNQPIAVMLDLMNPTGAGGRSFSHNRLGRNYKAGRKALNPHDLVCSAENNSSGGADL